MLLPSEGPRPALASSRPVLAPLSTPGEQKRPTSHRTSNLASVGQLVVSASAGPKPPAASSVSILAPKSLGQLVISASAMPRPPPATLGPILSPTSKDQKQLSPTSVGPKPALAASGLSLALASQEQPLQSPSSPSPVPSPTLSPSQEQTLAPAPMTLAPASERQLPAKQKDAVVPRPIPPPEGCLQTPAQAAVLATSPPRAQASSDPRLSPSFRARPEAPRQSPEDPVLPPPLQTLPLEVSPGLPEPGTRSPGLLSPTFQPGTHSNQTVPPPLPKPPRSPSRSPSRSPNRSPCVPPAPETALPRPSTQNAVPGRSLSPNLQAQESPASTTTSPSSSWSAQPTCKSDPGFR